MVAFRPFEPGDEIAFRELNEAWITRHFSLEEADRDVLGNPARHILQPGGRILMATKDGRAVGCCALLAMEPGVFEIGKMTVHEDYRGLGIGKRLLRAVVDLATGMGATRLYLESNGRLQDAIHLYEAVGFRHLPPERVQPSPYSRSNVYMELKLG
ncbi:MAG: GNAT family N-acetyltransferase [Acidobacteriota bacterium]